MKHIGIVGVSSEGAALCYQTIVHAAYKKLGGCRHPRICMDHQSLQEYVDRSDKRDWDGVAQLLIDSVQTVARMGADFGIIPANSVHYAFDQVRSESPIPLLSIVEVAADECQVRGYKKVAVLGVKVTMSDGLYKKPLEDRGIIMAVPSIEDQNTVDKVIHNNILPGKVTVESVKKMVDIITRIKKAGCDAVILGCTEIPLIIDENNSSLPTIDTTRLLARKALEHALNG